LELQLLLLDLLTMAFSPVAAQLTLTISFPHAIFRAKYNLPIKILTNAAGFARSARRRARLLASRGSR
jgi:hypothetical protein